MSSLEAAWPGGPGNTQWVDFVGLDVFDVQPTTSSGSPTYNYSFAQNWANNTYEQLTGAQAFESSEGVSGVPLAFPEWGVQAPGQSGEPGGMGDDPLFINNMYCFMKTAANNVAYESYDNVSESGFNSQITPGGGFMTSLAAFQNDFGGLNPVSCS